MGVYEVTFAEWDACVNAGGCQGHSPDDMGWGRGRIPVTNVSWDDAWEYTAWLSELTGEVYRLLSEAEWEYVARAGTRTERYWGDDASDQCRYANGDDEAVSCSDRYEYAAPVGSFQANAFGLHDVLGNLWEWTEDCWNDDYTGAPADGSAWRVGDCSQRVQRGGSLGSPRVILRSALRLGQPTEERLGWNGFRVARAVGGAGPSDRKLDQADCLRAPSWVESTGQQPAVTPFLKPSASVGETGDYTVRLEADQRREEVESIGRNTS